MQSVAAALRARLAGKPSPTVQAVAPGTAAVHLDAHGRGILPPRPGLSTAGETKSLGFRCFEGFKPLCT